MINKITLANLLDERYNKIILKEKLKLIQEWKNLDSNILKTRNKNWIVKDFRSRTIFNPNFGIIKFRRRRYVNKITKEYKILLRWKNKSS